MVSSIGNISPHQSIYSDGAHNESINELISAACHKKGLDEDLNGSTAKSHLDALFDLSKKNDLDSIELLQNLALGDGDISSYAQDLICKLITKHDGSTYDAASSARSGCQKLITGFSSSIVTDEVLNNHPKLLLAASSKIDGDGPNLDAIPQTVKSKVNQFDAMEEKPQWWLDSELHDGVFNKPDLSNIKNKDHLVTRHKLPDDGACQFRAAFALRDKDSKWLSATKNEIRDALEEQSEIIKQAIKDSVAFLSIPEKFKNFFDKENYADDIYNKTIGTGEFTLYSPRGVESSIAAFSSLTADENEFLSMLCDCIGERIKEGFNLPLDSNSSSAYAEHTGNHYNIVVPSDFFNAS